MSPKPQTAKGFTLVELVMAMALGAISILFLNQQITEALKLGRLLSIDGEILEATSNIAKEISCDKTLAAIQASNGGAYPPPGGLVNLVNAKSEELFAEAGTPSGPFSVARRIKGTKWYAKSIWNGDSITVQIAKRKVSSDNFELHPTKNTLLDFGERKHQIYTNAGDLGVPLCPAKDNSVYAVFLVATTTGVINNILGKSFTSSCHDTRSNPVQPNVGCHTHCVNSSYTTGFMLDCSDQDYLYDSNGVLISVTPAVPGYGWFACSCLK